MTCRFNYEKLVNAVCDRGITSSDVAEALNISERQYLLRLCNREEFTMEEIEKLADRILKIPPEQILEYFFEREM